MFGRRPSSQFRGSDFFNGRVFVGTGTEIPGFSSLRKIANNEFNINADGRLGVRENRADGSQQDLFLSPDGQLFGGAGLRVEDKTKRDFARFGSLNRNKFNRRGRVDAFNARQNGNVLGQNGIMIVDLSSIPHPNKNVPPGSPQQQQFALATLNYILNSLSNSSTILRVFPQNIRRDRNGKAFAAVNLARFFGNEALSIMAASDPTFRCTGKLRLQTLVSTVMDPNTFYRVKGIQGFNRNQIFDALGVEDDKTRTINNKILIAGNPGGPNESGVSSSTIGRVAKFLNQRNVPGGTCYETDDFNERNAPGEETNSRDVKQVGINYTQDASEVLCHQRNGFMLGMLFNAGGNLINEAPNSIARGGSHTGPTIANPVACMDCHAKGFLAGGRKIHHAPNEFYKDNFNAIPGNATVFRDQFGRQLRNRDFFTNNQTYRQRANRDTAIFYRALAKSGSLIVDDGSPEVGSRNNRGYPMPVVPITVKKYGEALEPKDMAAELGVAEATLRGAVGNLPGKVERRNFDNAFCTLKARVSGGAGALGFAGERGQSALRGGSAPAFQGGLGTQHFGR